MSDMQGLMFRLSYTIWLLGMSAFIFHLVQSWTELNKNHLRLSISFRAEKYYLPDLWSFSFARYEEAQQTGIQRRFSCFTLFSSLYFHVDYIHKSKQASFYVTIDTQVVLGEPVSP